MPKFKKRRPGVRVDKTPMVELMFVLLSFHAVTTAFN